VYKSVGFTFNAHTIALAGALFGGLTYTLSQLLYMIMALAPKSPSVIFRNGYKSSSLMIPAMGFASLGIIGFISSSLQVSVIWLEITRTGKQGEKIKLRHYRYAAIGFILVLIIILSSVVFTGFAFVATAALFPFFVVLVIVTIIGRRKMLARLSEAIRLDPDDARQLHRTVYAVKRISGYLIVIYSVFLLNGLIVIIGVAASDDGWQGFNSKTNSFNFPTFLLELCAWNLFMLYAVLFIHVRSVSKKIVERAQATKPSVVAASPSNSEEKKKIMYEKTEKDSQLEARYFFNG